jgi:hypothetical protein
VRLHEGHVDPVCGRGLLGRAESTVSFTLEMPGVRSKRGSCMRSKSGLPTSSA